MTHTAQRTLFVSTAILVAISAVLLAYPAYAGAPHVALSRDTDSCAICHRSHSSASTITADPTQSLGAPGNALIVGTFDGNAADTMLCYSCHDGLGSVYDTYTEFQSSSVHLVAPDTSDYGPTPKGCYSCHDSHGSMKDASGTPYPALLESKSASATYYRSGDQYCSACHIVRSGNQFPGLAVWQQTAHSRALARSDGTKITCSICHEPHGSDNTALVVQSLTPPSAPDTVSVPANDRWLCYGCHANAQAKYPGGLVHQSSAHGSTTQTVPVGTEWATRLPSGSSASERLVGECQTCHAPHGVDDGSGVPIAKLLKAKGTALCYTCHGAGSTIATDMQSMDPTPAAGVPEVIVGFGATPSTAQFGRLQVYSRQTAAQATLDQAREFLTGGVGPVATGDFDGDGVAELLVARDGAPAVTAMTASALSGLRDDPGDMLLLGPAEHMVLADVLDDINNRPEIVTAQGTTLRFYRWDGVSLGLVGSLSTSGTITGLARGNILGTDRDEVAVTTNGPDGLSIVTGTTGTLSTAGPYATRLLPKGPSVGDMTGDGLGEIAVANSGETTALASVFRADGSEYAVAEEPATAQRSVSTLIGEVLTAVTPAGTSGAELVVLRDNPNLNVAGSRIFVYRQVAGGGLDVSQSRAIGDYDNPTQAAISDVNGDGRPEVLVALAGSWSKANNPSPPGVFTLRVQANNANIDGNSRFDAAGSESAGSGANLAWIAIADLGVIGRSEHADGAGAAHVSTETANFARHVECVDCHNSHEATATPQPAPRVKGPMKGSWGVSVLNAPAGLITYTEKPFVDYEYQVCLKCHGTWGASGRTRDIASEVDTRNASVHAVEGTSTASQATAGSFATATPAWSNDTVLHCTDCHGNANDVQPAGPHVSDSAPLLKRQYVGISPTSTSMFCYTCHRYDVYADGTADGFAGSNSLFYTGALGTRRLHSEHVLTHTVSCSACHESHGTAREHLMRGDVGFTHDATGGACANDCHTGGASHVYARP